MKKVVFNSFLLLLFFTACSKTVVFEPEQVEERLILNAQINASDQDHIAYAGISMTNTVASLPDAELKCFINGEHVSVAEEVTRKWAATMFQTAFTFPAGLKAGDILRLELSSGSKSVSAEVSVPQVGGVVESVDTSRSSGNMYFRIHLKDMSPEVNHYMIKLVHKAKVRIWKPSGVFEDRIVSSDVELSHDADPILDGVHLGGESGDDVIGTGVKNVYCVFSDRKFSEGTATIEVYAPLAELLSLSMDTLNYDLVESWHWAEVQLCSISKEEYSYIMAISSLKSFDYESSLLLEDPVIPSNVVGGEGFVTAFNVSSASLFIGKCELMW